MTPWTHSALVETVDLLEPIGLDELMAHAALQTRVDRKYLVPPDVVAKIVDELSGTVRVLEMSDNRAFRYQSVYFDTDDYRSFHQHVQGRRRRFKVRTRTYLDTDTCQLEVKVKGGRSETVKSRLEYDPADAFFLTAEGYSFVAEHTGQPESELGLQPVLLSDYQRTTLVDLEALTRVTCDVGLVWESTSSSTPNTFRDVVVETKSAGQFSPFDMRLRAFGYRPISISKYCIGVALLNPDLHANRWSRTLRHHFDWTRPGQPATTQRA